VALMAEPGSSEALSSKMLLALSDDGLLKRVACNGSTEVRNNYGWTKIATRLQHLYADVLS